jgi:Zn-dependent protease
MDRGINLGKIFGIKINIDYSWFLIFILLTWNLAVSFGNIHAEWPGYQRWGVGVVAALLFFGSVLAHELAHSLVSIANGLSVRRITLFLFGGVSNIQKHPPSPKAEFLITIVGPLTSFVLGVLFVILGGFGLPEAINTMATLQEYQSIVEGAGVLPTLLIWLGAINILLAFFNLIPGFPLDGGRILRSIFWQVTNDLKKATRWASWVGQGVAWTFMFGGISMAFGAEVPFFGTGLVDGLWLAFIGWFLNNASQRSYQHVVIEDVLEDVTVGQVARKSPPTVEASTSIDQLVHERIMQSDDQAFPVIDEKKLFVGLVTLDDVRGINKRDWGNHTVKSIMTPKEKLITVTPDEDAARAFRKLSANKVRQLPVLEQGKLAGLFRRNDIIRWLQL